MAYRTEEAAERQRSGTQRHITSGATQDIETGGLETHRPIIQMAAVAVDDKLNEIEEFEVKIQFEESRACPDALRKIHYRRAEWKRSAIPPSKAAWSFARFLRQHASVEMYGRDLSVFRVAQLASCTFGELS